jgi:hypothetical protein
MSLLVLEKLGKIAKNVPPVVKKWGKIPEI